MASYLLHQMTASCFVTIMMKTKLSPAETNTLVEIELHFMQDFYTPIGITGELDNVADVSGSSTSSIKLITLLKETTEFLDALHSLAKEYSLHEKHASYSLKTIDEVTKLVEQCVS